nr:hypothetical protein [Tanacetum cinerariifolium]
MLVVPAAVDGADAVAAGAAATHDVLPPSVHPTHSSSSIPGPFSAPRSLPVREPSPSNEASQTPAVTADGGVKDSVALTALSLKLDRCIHRVTTLENELGVTKSNGCWWGRGPAAITALSFKLDRCLNRVTTLENELGITKKVLGGVVLKLVIRVMWLEGLLQQQKRRLVLSDSEGEDTTPTEQDINLEALHTLARMSLGGDSSDTPAGHDATEVLVDTSMPFRSSSTTRRRLRKPFSFSASAHVPKNVPAGAGIFAAATTIPAGSPMDAAVYSADAPSSSIPTAANKGKAPMVDDSIPANLLFEQERVLKNLHDSQLGEELGKKIHAEQEAEFVRQRDKVKRLEGLLQQRKRRLVLSDSEGEDTTPTEKDIDLEALHTLARTSLGGDSSDTPAGHDAAELGEELAKKIHAKQEAEFTRQQEELAQKAQAERVASPTEHGPGIPKPTLNAPSAKRDNQGVPQVPAASSQVPASVPAASTFATDASVFAATTPEVPAAESHLADTPTAHISVEHSVAASTHSSSRRRRKHIAKKWVNPIVDIADASLIKFDIDSGSDDDPLPYTPYAGWKMVPSPLGFVHAYSDLARHTKNFTSLRELLHMVERTDLQKLLGTVDNLYQREDPDTFAFLLWGDLHVLF